MITELVDVSAVKILLGESSLPTSDVSGNEKIRFFGTYHHDSLLACIGVEVYGDTALLRSLAVASGWRNGGLGRRLVEYLESMCQQNGVQEIFLLTETAEHYFDQLGYTCTPRAHAPFDIKNTTQFSTLCPCSSRLMVKILSG